MRTMLSSMLRAALLLPVLITAAAAQDKPPSVSLNSPNCVKAPEARGELPDDEELGVGRKGEYCAYPVRMMAYHRVVNDHLGGPLILVLAYTVRKVPFAVRSASAIVHQIDPSLEEASISLGRSPWQTFGMCYLL